MKLLTAAQRQRLIGNGTDDADHAPEVKWFQPGGPAVWLVSALNPENPDIAFCLADLGMGCPELGTVLISEIEAVRNRFGPVIERDPHFRGQHPIGVYADAAYAAGQIVEWGPALDAADRRRRARIAETA